LTVDISLNQNPKIFKNKNPAGLLSHLLPWDD